MAATLTYRDTEGNLRDQTGAVVESAADALVEPEPDTIGEWLDGPGQAGATSGRDVSSSTNDPMPEEPKTELGYAHRLIRVYGDRLRYVLVWRRWLVWDGKHWADDTTGQAKRWMKAIARRIYTDALTIVDDQ